MTAQVLSTTTQAATLAAGAGHASTGEAFQFWVLAIIAVIAAIGMVSVRKAVHSALLLALTMLCLAVFYIAQGAYFLGIVQVVVYTGAVMMLFLFVLMLVGVDASDSLVETLRGQRWAAALAGIGFGVLLIAGLANASLDNYAGLSAANSDGNVPGIAALLFTRYVWAFEVTSALLITAALGAMVLAHRERTAARRTQRELSEQRFKAGGQVTPLPSPGVYARHNAVDVPGLLPDGSPAELTINATLRGRGDVRRIEPTPAVLSAPAGRGVVEPSPETAPSGDPRAELAAGQGKAEEDEK